ncbi:UNVERIFIED_CONTAM: hypothetical protein GTU68_014341 [Idotea baltica]|nr:hypothetical protein [Idotea baltica]
MTGGNSLRGEVQVSGAKNAALPLLISALLSEEECRFENVPNLDDIAKLMRMFRSITRCEAPYGLVKALRASFWVLGPLIARTGRASVALPGGDAIGTRPVDLHLSGLAKFGEAATYLLGAAITCGDVTVRGIPGSILESILDLLKEAGAEVESGDDYIRVCCKSRLKAVSFDTAPFPGIATDVQPLLMAALCTAEGTSCAHETVFESRFGHVAEFRRFGADITIDKRRAFIEGTTALSGAPVEGLDIRAAAGMVLLGLVAEGQTQVRDIHHLDRGYDGLVVNFQNLGANIKRLPVYEVKEEVWGC